MATNVINIRNFVDVTTGVQTVSAGGNRSFNAVLFVQKGVADSGVGAITAATSVQEVADVAGSNSEATAAATTFFGTSYFGFAPNATFYFVSIGAETTEEFQTNFTKLVSDERFFGIILDKAFTKDFQIAAAEITKAAMSTTEHIVFLDDHSAEAANQDLETDTTSISAYIAKNNNPAAVAAWSQPNADTAYYSIAEWAFYATREFNATARAMSPIVPKTAGGLTAVDLTWAGITVSPDIAYRNLMSKRASIFANIKLVGLTGWAGGTTADGANIDDKISAAYLNYRITMSVFNLLQNTNRLPMNANGASLLRAVISSAFNELNAAGIITGGTSIDGEIFPELGYNIRIPLPTGVDRANGLWKGIACSALLAGSGRKVEITNILKQ